VLEALLRQSKLEALFSEDGVEALELIASRKFSVVILDLRLPRLDGFGVIDELRRVAPDMLRKIVVVTGIDDEGVERIAVDEIGAILRKPIDLQEFQRVMALCSHEEERFQ
jgi:two-component system cell cycle response regulator DivK